MKVYICKTHKLKRIDEDSTSRIEQLEPMYMSLLPCVLLLSKTVSPGKIGNCLVEEVKT